MKKGIRATVDIWISRIGSVFGWFWGVLYTLVAVVAFSELTEAKDHLDRVMPFVCLGMAALHFLIVRASARTAEKRQLYSPHVITKRKETCMYA